MANELFGWGYSGPGSSFPEYGMGVDFSPFVAGEFPAKMPGSSWKMVAGGGGYVLAIDSSDNLWAWGNNTYGKLGIGNTTTQYEPVMVGSAKWNKVGASLTLSVGIQDNGSLWIWGRGIGSDKTVPTLLDNGQWVDVSEWNGALLGIKSDKSLWVIGKNSSGQLGAGNYLAVNALTRIGSSSWEKVSAGTSCSFAIDSVGALWATGFNYYGGLGVGDALTKNVFTKVSDGPWVDVQNSGDQTTGIKADGSLHAWGLNSTDNPLGVGSGVGTSVNGENIVLTPHQIGTEAWATLPTRCGGETLSAVKANGKVCVWGRCYSGMFNDPGQSGVYTMSSPKEVGRGICLSATIGRNTSTMETTHLVVIGDGFFVTNFWTNFSGQTEIL